MSTRKPKNTPRKKSTKPSKKLPQEFTPGNEFWKARSTHGRDKIFETPDIMAEAVLQYVEWNNNNPLIDYQAQGGVLVKVPKMRAMTMQGLCRFLGVNTQYFGQFKRRIHEEELVYDQLKNPTEEEENKHNLNIGFSLVIAEAEEIVFEQKFTGAAAGFLNANLISRDLGMLDKKEVNLKNDGGAFQGQVTVYHIPDNGRPVMSQEEQPGQDAAQQ